MTLIRSLSTIEQSFSIANAFSPLYIVCVLQLQTSPTVADLKKCLEQLQSRHLLLRATLEEKANTWEFHEKDPLPSIYLEILERKTVNDWRKATEKALNTPFTSNSPLLMRCIFLRNTSNERVSELLVVFHHAIVDSVGARLILHEILSLLGNAPLSPPMDSLSHSLAMPSFPADFQGWKLKRKLLPFMARQMQSEMRYAWKGLTKTIPSNGYNRIVSLQFDVQQSRKIMLTAGKKGLTLNSLLSAAMLMAVHQELFNRQKGLLRSIGFASMREGMNCVVTAEELGSCISMLRFDVPVSEENNFWEVARHLQRQMMRAGKKGEVYLNAHLSKSLIKMMLKQSFMRLATTALSFIGPLNLQPKYGNLDLLRVHTFITNNQFGPIFTGFAKVLFGEIGLDCNYLEGDISADTAKRIMKYIEGLIEENCLS